MDSGAADAQVPILRRGSPTARDRSSIRTPDRRSVTVITAWLNSRGLARLRRAETTLNDAAAMADHRARRPLSTPTPRRRRTDPLARLDRYSTRASHMSLPLIDAPAWLGTSRQAADSHFHVQLDIRWTFRLRIGHKV